MIVWGAIKRGADGKDYGVRYLLTREELAGLQKAGLVGEVEQIDGMQAVADGIVAMYEREAVLACGIGSMKHEQRGGTRHYWLPQDDQALREGFDSLSLAELCRKLGASRKPSACAAASWASRRARRSNRPR